MGMKQNFCTDISVRPFLLAERAGRHDPLTVRLSLHCCNAVTPASPVALPEDRLLQHAVPLSCVFPEMAVLSAVREDEGRWRCWVSTGLRARPLSTLGHATTWTEAVHRHPPLSGQANVEIGAEQTEVVTKADEILRLTTVEEPERR